VYRCWLNSRISDADVVSRQKRMLKVQLVSKMLMGGCGVEQDSAAELWEAVWILVWDLFSTFFFWQCQHISIQQIQDRPFPVQLWEKNDVLF